MARNTRGDGNALPESAREMELRTRAERLESRFEQSSAELADAHDHVRRLASELLLAEQRVRQSVARRLHDDLQQQLYGVQMRIAALRMSIADPGSDIPAQLQEVEHWLAGAVSTTRRLAIDLSPPVRNDESLVQALGWLAAQMHHIHGLHVEIRSHSSADSDNEDLRQLVFEAVKELLFTVVKHGDPPAALIDVRTDGDCILVDVTDHGPGLDVSLSLSLARTDGFGLTNLLERLRLFGADLKIDSAPGRPTRVRLIAPLAFRPTEFG
jgi:signal transduction histidine kinase